MSSNSHEINELKPCYVLSYTLKLMYFLLNNSLHRWQLHEIQLAVFSSFIYDGKFLWSQKIINVQNKTDAINEFQQTEIWRSHKVKALFSYTL